MNNILTFSEAKKAVLNKIPVLAIPKGVYGCCFTAIPIYYYDFTDNKLNKKELRQLVKNETNVDSLKFDFMYE